MCLEDCFWVAGSILMTLCTLMGLIGWCWWITANTDYSHLEKIFVCKTVEWFIICPITILINVIWKTLFKKKKPKAWFSKKKTSKRECMWFIYMCRWNNAVTLHAHYVLIWSTQSLEIIPDGWLMWVDVGAGTQRRQWRTLISRMALILWGKSLSDVTEPLHFAHADC